MKNDQLNHGYLSHGVLAKVFRIIDFIGYRIFSKLTCKITGNKLLFINLGLIGDLILFRYVIEDFLRLDYAITILIQEKYLFLFDNIQGNDKIKLLTISNYKDKKFLSGFVKIYSVLKHNKEHFSASLHFRGYLGTGILSTYMSKVSDDIIAYGTSGFGFLVNKRVNWCENVHETTHVLDILRAIEPNYSTIRLDIFNNYLVNTGTVLNKLKLSNKDFVVIHATSQDAKKNIPPDILRYTIDYFIKNTNLNLVFVGAKHEIEYCRDCVIQPQNERIFFTNGLINFFEIFSLMNGAKFFVGIDSSIAHLVSSLDLPKIITWHSQNILSQWIPLGNNVYIIDNLDKNNVIIDKLKNLKLLVGYINA